MKKSIDFMVDLHSRASLLATMAFYISDDVVELFNYSDSEGEFEGFPYLDYDLEPRAPVNAPFDVNNWVHGNREAPELVFRATPGLTPEALAILSIASFLDYFGLFFRAENFVTMAEQTNVYARQYLATAKPTFKENSRFYA